MSLDGFMPKNAAIDKICAEATNHEELRERLKAALAGDGLIARQGTDYGATLLQQPSAPSASDLALPDGRLERIVYIQNDGLRLTASSPEELDRLEASVRGQR